MGNYKYDKENTKMYRIKANQKTDADIIAYLEQATNVQAYFKALIRADIAANGAVLKSLAAAPSDAE